jgi:hypothetical protein
MGRRFHIDVAMALVAAVLALCAAGGSPARADCLETARRNHAAHAGKAGCFVAQDGKQSDVSGARTGCDPATTFYYFEVEATAEAKANESPAGTGLSRLDRDCWAVELAAPPASPADGAREPDTKEKQREEARARVYYASSVADVFKAYQLPEPSSRSFIAGRGTGAASDAVGEALQILGQIVVDRATQAAYSRIGRIIREGLGCPEPDEKSAGRGRFPATCEALATLRIQDLAMARTVLVRALVSDLVARAIAAVWLDEPATAAIPLPPTAIAWAAPLLGGRGLAASTEDAGADAPLDDAAAARGMQLLVDPLIRATLATLADPARSRHGFTARLIEEEVVSFAYAYRDETPRRLRPMVLAGAALLKCTTAFDDDKLASCPISQLVDQLAEDRSMQDIEPKGRAVARSVARGMLAAISATEGTAAEPAPVARLAAAVSGLFDGACYALKEVACPPILDAGLLPGDASLVWLSTARGAIEAAIDEDTNRLIASIAAGAQRLADLRGAGTSMTRKERRALRLLAGVVQYAGTFSKSDGATEDKRHEQRSKILESLTADMTQRTDRDGDWVVSLGGSLGLVGGRRVWSGERSIWTGPLSLSLGAAIQKVGNGGLHVEVGLVDLAQYLAFQRETASADGSRGIAVGEPELPDALAPSLKVGIQWGHDVPFYAAAMVGYSPFYEFTRADGSTSKMGSLNLGVAVGAYVPLFDAN